MISESPRLLTGLALAMGLAIVMPYEGLSYHSYLDPIGIPTVCYGHTGTDVQLGQERSAQECEALLQQDLGDALAVVDQSVKVVQPITRRAALASFVYNVGERNFRRSTLLERLNQGDVQAACDEMTRWVYAGHGEHQRALQGLVRRRAMERRLCLYGTNPPEPEENQS